MKRMKIGETDHEKLNRIRALYDTLCGDLTLLLSQLRDLFGNEIGLPELYDYINARKSENWLNQKFVERIRDQFPKGISLEKMIESDLIELPIPFTESVSDHKRIKQTLQSIKIEGFFYPVKDLFQADEIFKITPDFDKKNEQFNSNYTSNEQQNEALAALETICKGVNQCHRLGIFNLNVQGINVIGIMMRPFFKINHRSEHGPMIVNRYAFVHLSTLGKIADKEQFEFDRLFEL